MLRSILAFLLFALPAFSQGWYYAAPAAAGGGSCSTNVISVNALTSFGDTSNNTLYVTASYTPNSNSLVIAAIASGQTAPALSPSSVTGNGLTWWKVAETNYDTLGTPIGMLSVWASQGNASTVPSSGGLTATFGATQTGCNIHVMEFLGASTNTLWGTNAIVQIVMRGSNGVANPRLDWQAPGNDGSNAFFVAVADDVNSAADNGPQTGWTENAETAFNTAARGLATYYRLTVPASATFTTNGATSRDWAAIALEIEANRNGCSDPLTNGLIAFYKLNEGAAGNDAVDTEGNNLTEAGTGGVGSAAGKIGNARDFEAGDNDEFNHADGFLDFNGDVSFTMAMWVKFESVPGTVMTTFGKYDSDGQAQWFLGKWSDGTFSFLTSSDGSSAGENRCSSVGTASAGVWYHLRAGRDASADLNFISLDNATEVTVASTTIFNSTSLVRLGNCLTSLRMDGLIDNVMVWNRAIRSGQEATLIYTRPFPVK